MKAIDCRAEGFYVVDEMTTDPSRRVLSGPFARAEYAEQDRQEFNIADDCLVVLRVNGFWRTHDEAPNCWGLTYRSNVRNEATR